MQQAGIRKLSSGSYPRIHDLRHTYAVHALELSISKGMDPYCSLPALSTYMGHKGIESTEYYLRLTKQYFVNVLNYTQEQADTIFRRCDDEFFNIQYHDVFTNYLPNTVGYSENTIKSYRDTFVLLFLYAEEEHLTKRGKISIELFRKDTIVAFLEWLEIKRGVSVSTRNQRLAALKSFSRYMSLNTVEYLDTFQAVLDIPPKKGSSKTVDYLTVEAITLLLKEPDASSYSGIRDLAILSLLYESGCRVQELIDLKYGDLSLNSPATISVTGKGNKQELFP